MNFDEYKIMDLPVVLKYNDKYDKTQWETVLQMCDNNDPEALYEAASRYRLGEGVEEDIEKAKEYYERTLKYQKHTGALYQVGFYYECQEAPEEIKKSFDYYSLGSELGDGRCTSSLGDLYRYGVVVKSDLCKARDLYEKAVFQNYYPAHRCIGELLLNEDDYEEAMKHFEVGYENCDGFQKAWMAYRIGQMYFHGYGVPEDPQKALPYLLEANENNVSGVNGMLGCIYAYGVAGEQNTQKAISYLTNVGDDEKPGALFICGDILLKENRTDEAISYLKSAASLGNEKAKEVLDQISMDEMYLRKRTEEGSAQAMVQLCKLLMGRDGAAFVEAVDLASTAYGIEPESPRVMMNYCYIVGLDAHVKKQIGATDDAYATFRSVISVMQKLVAQHQMSSDQEKKLNFVYYDAGLCAWATDKKDEAIRWLQKADKEKYPYAVALLAYTHYGDYLKSHGQENVTLLDEDLEQLGNTYHSENFESDFQKAFAHLTAALIYHVHKNDIVTAYEHCKSAYSLDQELAKDEFSHYSVGLFGKIRYN